MSFDILHIVTTTIIGLYAGALLTEGMILVPYWRKMNPDDFFRLHGEMGPQLFRYFAPLTTSAVLLSVFSAASGFLDGTQNMLRWGVALACLSALAIFYIYFKRANESFADHSLTNEELGTELTKWAAWHWLRTLLLIAALAVSILAILKG